MPARNARLSVPDACPTRRSSALVSLTVNAAPDFTLSATPPSQTVVQGAAGNYSVTVNPTNGFTAAATLSVGGLPAGGAGSFTPNPATRASTLAVTTGASTPARTY